MKFEQINLKFKKVRRSSRCNKVWKISKKFKIHIQSQLLSKDTQYCQHCNNVKLHAVQCTSTRFLTNAHFNNKGSTSSHKSLQKLEFPKICTVKHACYYLLFDCLSLTTLWTLSIIKFIKFERHNYETNRLLDFGSLVRLDYTSIQECIHEITPHRSLRRRSKRIERIYERRPMPLCRPHLITLHYDSLLRFFVWQLAMPSGNL